MSIHTENFARPEISRIAEDAARLRTEVEASPITISFAPVEVPSIPPIPPVEVPPIPPIEIPPVTLQVENLASPEISRVAEDAARVRSEIEASPITLSFGPVEAPLIPPVDVPLAEIMFAPIDVPVIPPIEVPPIDITFAPVEAPIMPLIEFPPIEAPSIPPIDVSSFEGAQVTFGEVGASAIEMGENVKAAGSSFTEMQMYAEASTVSLRTVAGGIRTTAMMGTELTMLASDFGIVDKETSKYMRTVMAIVMVVSTAARMYSFLTLMTTGHTVAVAVEGTTTMATAGALSFSSIAHGIYSAAKWAAVAASNALNISTATFLALTGVGIAVIVAATVAMWAFANSMNAATSSAQSFNAAAGEVPSHARGVQRAGEEDLYRRGVE
jgi:hypothetical protein